MLQKLFIYIVFGIFLYGGCALAYQTDIYLQVQSVYNIPTGNGGVSLVQDFCPDGDDSLSYYDGECNKYYIDPVGDTTSISSLFSLRIHSSPLVWGYRPYRYTYHDASVLMLGILRKYHPDGEDIVARYSAFGYGDILSDIAKALGYGYVLDSLYDPVYIGMSQEYFVYYVIWLRTILGKDIYYTESIQNDIQKLKGYLSYRYAGYLLDKYAFN